MTHGGSHYKNQKELVLWFCDQYDDQNRPLYNITALVWRDNKDLQERDNLRLHRADSDKPYDEKEVSLTKTIDELNELLMPYYFYELSLLNERKHILDELIPENFDLALIDCQYTQSKIIDYMKVPYMQ